MWGVSRIFLKNRTKILMNKIILLRCEHKICMGKNSCLKSTVNFIANFEWVKNRVLLSSEPMVISLTFLSASAVSGGTCTSSPHPSLKNMSDRAHGGMAKACFTVTKSPVNNLNGSQWMSPALSRDDTIAASPNKLQLSFWGAGGPIGALETRGNHRFLSPAHLPLQTNIYLKISHTAWVMTNVVW